MQLHGAVVAVTGAARGIGEATAAALVAAGARVALGDLDGGLARTAAARLGPAAQGFDLDVTSRASFTAFLDGAQTAFGPLDALVNNAGIMHVGDLLKEDDAAARRMVEVNVHGVLLGMKVALPGMLERNRGRVVNIASVAGKAGYPQIATYCATKHAVVGMSDAARQELAGTGVRVSAVLPSVVRTELAAGAADVVVGQLTPATVAEAVLLAIRTGRAEVFVPRKFAVLHGLTAGLPAAARHALSRLLGGQRVWSSVGATRTAYEHRAARSAPGAPGQR